MLPVRSTPVASANTLGRPSNTNPTTPSGARHDDTDHFGWSIVDSNCSRRIGDAAQLRRPADMSARIDGDRTRRVVERPFAAAAATSARIGLEHRRERRVVVDRVREPLEEVADLLIGASRRARRTHRQRAVTAAAASWCSVARDVQQIAGVLHDHQTIARSERCRELGRHDAGPITAVDQHLALRPDWSASALVAHRSLRRGDLIGG